MIVSEKYQYIYIGIPKTGTNSMTDWLLRRFDGKVLGCQHDWSVPDKYRDYTVFTTVRDPWQRCLSLWRFTVMKGKQDMSFASYMRQVLLWSREGCPWHETPEAYMSQADYVHKAGVTLALKLENIGTELVRLPFVTQAVTDFPDWNSTRQCFGADGMKQPVVCSKEAEQLVMDYCRHDFSLFAYDGIIR